MADIRTQKIVVLGSTGSIGKQALSVVTEFPERFTLTGICAYTDADTLIAQAKALHPKYVGIADPRKAEEVSTALPECRVFAGRDSAMALATIPEADTIIHGVRGFYGTLPLLAALEDGKRVALANKESIVCANGLVQAAKEKGGGVVVPVDSEQSAIFQCIGARQNDSIKKIMLTASGGPFFGWTRDMLRFATVEQALKHPTWHMGRKITLDSATLFNKGLEIMEASRLFSVPAENIEVVVHPQSVVHSLVEFVDGSVIAQMSRPDMRLAIQYALTWPERTEGGFGGLDLIGAGSLEFHAPDTKVFRAIPLAYEALRLGGTVPTAYNAANEIAAERFFTGDIGFLDIQDAVEYTIGRCDRGEIRELTDVLHADAAARRLAREFKPKATVN